MTTDAHEYLAQVWPNETVDAPSALWRRGSGEPEYLSSIDWEWHAGAEEFADRPAEIFVPITTNEARALQSDRQRFVRYWSYQHPNTETEPEKENRVYRRRRSPDQVLDEVFGPANEWVETPLSTSSRWAPPLTVPR